MKKIKAKYLAGKHPNEYNEYVSIMDFKVINGSLQAIVINKYNDIELIQATELIVCSDDEEKEVLQKELREQEVTVSDKNWGQYQAELSQKIDELEFEIKENEELKKEMNRLHNIVDDLQLNNKFFSEKVEDYEQEIRDFHPHTAEQLEQHIINMLSLMPENERNLYLNEEHERYMNHYYMGIREGE